MRSHLKLVCSVLVLALMLSLTVSVFAQDEEPLITFAENDTFGQYFVGEGGMTLYTFDRDTLDVTNCYDRCAENWPPLLVESAEDVTAVEGIPGEWGVTERTDGTLNVTYNGMPLYYWVRDEAPGETTGHNVGRVWWVVLPATVYVSLPTEDLGTYLVGPTGMTLYTFSNDEPGVSNCTGDCAEAWPPLTVESADDLVKGVNMLGELSTIEREDGTLQVTYNGWPLYYYAEDTARGDANGQGAGDVWWVVHPEAVGVVENAETGNHLVAFNGMTLYTFDNDTEGVSTCTEDCAEAWPAYTIASEDALVGSADLTGELGTAPYGEDGALQVTYNGMPLYFYVEDAAPGDTLGHAVGDVWWVATNEGM